MTENTEPYIAVEPMKSIIESNTEGLIDAAHAARVLRQVLLGGDDDNVERVCDAECFMREIQAQNIIIQELSNELHIILEHLV